MLHQILLVLLAASEMYAMKTENTDKMEQLVNDLMKTHMPYVMPEPGMTMTTMMYMMCADKDILHPHMMMVKMLEKYTWTDHRMKWEPKDYDGIKKIYLPMAMVWTPDMAVYDGEHEMVAREDIDVMITNTGMMTWMPMTTYRMRCGRDTTMKKPTHMMDTESNTHTTCHMTMGSATMDEEMMTMAQDGKGMDMSMYGTRCPMKVTNPTVKVESSEMPCCEGTYSTLKMKFNIHM